MAFTLYNYVLSGNCYKVRLMASLLNVNYEAISVDFHPGRAHKSEAMLQLNPAGTLPVLVTDTGAVLTETQAMLVWLAERFDTDRRWWPQASSAEQSAQLLQWLGFASRLGATIGELRLHSMLNKAIDAEPARSGATIALRELESHLTEQRIRGCQWLAGDAPTVADIACFPYTALSPDAGIEHDPYPAIRSWLHALRSLPGFVTMPGIYELHEERDPGPHAAKVIASGAIE
jgi:glutathione S-transferase